MMKERAANVFRSDDGRRRLKASNGLMSAVGAVLRLVEGVREVRVLHRDDERSKFFVVLENLNAEGIHAVVQTMVQIEETFGDEQFDYDTIGVNSVDLIPASAKVVSTGS